jgi:hypothetical protein
MSGNTDVLNSVGGKDQEKSEVGDQRSEGGISDFELGM